jgi:hypothetical protein
MNETAANTLPATSPLHGFFWSWGVPILLFAITAAATWLLYRHFANRNAGE